MKLEFPTDESFSRGLMCHDSVLKLMVHAWVISLKAWSNRMNQGPLDPMDLVAMSLNPRLTDAADAAIISVIRSLIDEERLFRGLDRANNCAELENLLSDFLKSHRPPRTKKPSKQPTTP